MHRIFTKTIILLLTSGAVMGGLGAKLGSVSRVGGEGAKKVSSQAGTMGLVGLAAGFTSGVVQQTANWIRGKEISVSSIYLEAMAGGIGGGIAGKIIGKSQAPGWWRVVGGGALSGGIAGGIQPECNFYQSRIICRGIQSIW